MAALAGHTPVSNGLLAAIFLFNNRPRRHVTSLKAGVSNDDRRQRGSVVRASVFGWRTSLICA